MNLRKSVLCCSRQQGFTLIEALVVMIVGIVILAASAAGIGKLLRNSEISTEASNITLMRDNLKDLRNGKDYFTGIKNSLAIRYKAIPANMSWSGEKIVNAWGGDVNIGSTDGGKVFFIDYYNVPTEACQMLVLKLGTLGWKRIQINDAKIQENFTLADLGKFCKDDSGDRNKMAFVGD
ncbi:type 4 pilus major pilin [Burkholderia sp. BCC0044]|uniref:type 4 pilus major pilin n=1 Tax=Burkholderia sp. BCC0044 TaxID=2676295 RepID=UPI00158AA287|nr:type 4 pilus major pilin [Burkholderia sp. BCC0044]